MLNHGNQAPAILSQPIDHLADFHEASIPHYERGSKNRSDTKALQAANGCNGSGLSFNRLAHVIYFIERQRTQHTYGPPVFVVR